MNAILKYPGSKWAIANWIISYLPKHDIYCEPFFGSGAIYFNKPISKHEIINDLDGRVVNLFRVCRDNPKELARLIEMTPYARQEFDFIQEKHSGEEINLTGDPVEDARRFLVRCWQCFGTKLSDRAGWKTNRSESAPRSPIVWSQLPEQILLVADRLKSSQIECRPALEIIKGCNRPECLIYADPPYQAEVRGKKFYSVEMMEEKKHIELLEVLQEHQGSVILSGYDNDLYNDILTGWSKESHCATSTGSGKRTEVIWMNYEVQYHLSKYIQ